MALKNSDTGSWNSDTSYIKNGGMAMNFEVKNVNILGATLTIESNYGRSQSKIIPPLSTMEFSFKCFRYEPMIWKFDISTNSAAFILTWIYIQDG